MAQLKLRPLMFEDTLALREQDELAIRLAGFEPSTALAHSAKISTESWMVEINGEPAFAWGYGSHGLVGTTAYGWLLTSELVEGYPIQLLRASRHWRDYLLARFLRIEVQVHKTHKTSRNWLTWLGFTSIGEDAEFYTLEKVR